MKTCGLLIAIALYLFGTVFLYISFFEKDITKSSALINLLSGLGCLALSAIIGLLAEIVHTIQNKN